MCTKLLNMKYPFILMLALAACHSNSSVSNYDMPDSKDSIIYDVSTKDTGIHYSGMSIHDMTYHVPVDEKANLKEVLIEQSEHLHFSNPTEPDVFTVKIVGDKYYKASVVFTIHNAAGQEIFHDVFPCNALMRDAFDGNGEYGTEIQKEAFMKKYLDDFFKPSKIRKPAIAATDNFIEEYKKGDHWQQVANDPEAIRFVYTKVANGHSELAYCPSQQKFLLFYEY